MFSVSFFEDIKIILYNQTVVLSRRGVFTVNGVQSYVPYSYPAHASSPLFTVNHYGSTGLMLMSNFNLKVNLPTVSLVHGIVDNQMVSGCFLELQTSVCLCA